MSQQLSGDYLALNNHASLEIYHRLNDGKVVGVALRYRRPTSSFLTALLGGVDEMLYRQEF